jgi:hypothetical protein
MKIFVKESGKELDELMPEELLNFAINEVQCISKECTGKVHYLLKQTFDGSVAICPKCKKAISFKHLEV